jgi:hypothetical protein
MQTDDDQPSEILDATQDDQTGTWTVQPTDYRQLARPFDVVFRDNRGGVEFDYFTGEQAISRLNEQGPGFWDFEIIEHGVSSDADECWVLAKLTCRVIQADPNLPGELMIQPVVKMQFGSQKLKRARSTGNILDIGFDLKGAATDALKKCASQIGVGTYLWRKEGGIPAALDDGVPETAQQVGQGGRPRQLPPRRSATAPAPQPASREYPDDETVGKYEVIRAEAVTLGFKSPWIDEDPRRWTLPQLAGYQRLLESHITKRQALAS